MGIEVRRWRGGCLELLQATILTILFFGSVAMTGWIILIVGFFSDSRRCLHDYFSGTVLINKRTENRTIRLGVLTKCATLQRREDDD
ncbi:MAG: hypothetical protein CMM45_08025 [Rhodospirillaceae bacterium]|nr:hypothetical protein [Rhodospirillaceae bacterium]